MEAMCMALSIDATLRENVDFFEINVEKFSNFRWFFSKP